MPILLEHWTFQSTSAGKTRVLPDGCRDLIIKHEAGVAPVWFITDIAKTSETVSSRQGDHYNGFRLRPGMQIDQAGLMASLREGLTDTAILERLHSYVQESSAVSEALACLADSRSSVARTAADLGVTPRSLQRLLKRNTGQAPVFWMRLARVRRAAHAILQAGSLAELAYDMGYADQAHMSREMRTWLGVTPRQIRRDAGWHQQHLGLGYGA